MPETAEEISQQPEVRKELQRATGEKRHEKVKAHGRDKLWFVTHALILAGCAVLYLLLGSKLIPLPQPTIDIAGRVLRGAALIVIVLAIAKAASVYGLGRIEDASTRFTLQRIMHLVVALLIALIAISINFCQLVCHGCRAGRWINNHRPGSTNADEKFHRLDIYPRPPALSRGRSHQDR
jgi:hypothetical protein